MKFRLLKTGFLPGAQNMAIDEAVLENIAKAQSEPTLRFYGWNPPTISIGYFQSLEEEVDLMACKNLGVDTVRRVTGGGAVLHDHEITYSIHIPEALGLVPAGILESYEKICDGVIKGLAVLGEVAPTGRIIGLASPRRLGLEAKFVPLNDLVVMQNGGMKKISGNAQTRKQGILLQHGTILLKVDVDKMFSLLKVPSEKLKGKLIDDVKQRVTSVSLALGREVAFEEAAEALEKGFAQAFPEVSFEDGTLSAEEKNLAEKLVKEKYGAEGWNNAR
ncbi:MAG: biotin/lipoate A/B protein ligase family protein [Patescibacteria group bacterium]